MEPRLGLPEEVSQVAPTGVGPVTISVSILPDLNRDRGVAADTTSVTPPAKVLYTTLPAAVSLMLAAMGVKNPLSFQ
jgi:hypothetical protein